MRAMQYTWVKAGASASLALLASLASAPHAAAEAFHRGWKPNTNQCGTEADSTRDNPYSRCNLLKSKTTTESTPLEKLVFKGAGYAQRIFPILNADSGTDEIKNLVLSDAKNFLISTGTEYVNNYLLESIPFLTQAQVGVDFTTSADMTYFLDSVIRIAQLGTDEEGSPEGLLFAQGSAKGAYSGAAVTNLGLGIRHRVKDNAMVGANAFWDYRFTPYSSSYSRFGAGAELWWNDFKFSNNWYIAGTGIKRVTTNGKAYTDTSTLAAGTYDESTLLGNNTYDERVVPGWDIALNYRLPNYPQLAFGVRGFRWDYIKRNDNTGIEGSINWQATPHTNLSAWVSNEIPAYPTQSNSQLDDRNSDVYVGVRLKVQLQPVVFSDGDDRIKSILLTEMKQPVARRNDVLLERWKPKQKKTITETTSGFSNIAAGN